MVARERSNSIRELKNREGEPSSLRILTSTRSSIKVKIKDKALFLPEIIKID